MARRASDTGGMNLDSLMDTLTNVVGILLIILIFTVLGGVDAVKRIKGFVDVISAEQLKDTIAKANEMRKMLALHRENWEKLDNETPKVQVSLAQTKDLIAVLKTDLEKLASAKVNVEELKKQVEERRKRVQTIEQELNAREKEIASLQARLATTPARGPDQDAQVVNLPDPRDAPQGAKPIVFICRKGRVVPVDEEGLQKKAREIVEGAKRVLFRQNTIDCEKLTDLFQKRFVGDRYCQLHVRIGGDAKPYLAVEARADAGDATDTVGKRSSQFHHWVQEIDPKRFYLDFRVFGDAFDTYLEARNAAARQGLLAGWTPYAPNGEYRIPFGTDVKVTCLGKTPPKPAPSKPADPNRPAPPTDRVD